MKRKVINIKSFDPDSSDRSKEKNEEKLIEKLKFLKSNEEAHDILISLGVIYVSFGTIICSEGLNSLGCCACGIGGATTTLAILKNRIINQERTKLLDELGNDSKINSLDSDVYSKDYESESVKVRKR